MATAAAAKENSSTSNQGRASGAGGIAGAGGGGKIRKKPYRGTKTAPYDRPLTALRNCNNSLSNSNGWLSKLVDPASKLISSSARKLLSSVFQKRILPSAGQTQAASSDIVLKTKLQDASGMVRSATENLEDVAHNHANINFDEVAKLEQMLKQKTFTRYEADRLTVLLRSRYVGASIRDEEASEDTSDKVVNENVLGEPAYTYTPQRDNMPSAHKFSEFSPSPTARYEVFDEDIASPSEIAKAYMSSRSAKFSPKMSAFRCLVTPCRMPATTNALMSNIQSRHLDSGFTTPGSRGQSATSNIGNSPYSDLHPPTSLKGTELRRGASGEPSAPANELLFGQRRQYTISGSTEMSLKRRSSVLQDHFGSVGSIRRVRQKLNLLSSKGVDKPAFGSPISITEPQGQMEALTHVPTSVVDPAPAQSIEPAQRTAPRLNKFVSSQIEEPPGHTTIEKSSPQSGSIYQKYKKRESSKVRDAAQDDNNVDDPRGTSKLDTGFSGLEYGKPSKDEHTKLKSHSTTINPDAKYLKNTGQADKTISKDKTSALGPLQKKQAFRMSVFEDFVDMDEDSDEGNHNVSLTATSNGETLPVIFSDGGSTISAQLTGVENPSAFLPSGSSKTGGLTDLATSGGARNSIQSVTLTSTVESQSVSNKYAVQDIPSKFSTEVPVRGQDAALPISSSSLEIPDEVSLFRFNPSPSVAASAGISASNIYASGYRIHEPSKGDGVDDVQKDQHLFSKPSADASAAAPVSTTSGSLTLGPAVGNKSDLCNGSSSPGSYLFSVPPSTIVGSVNQNATNSTIVENHQAIDGISSIASPPTRPSLDLATSGAYSKQEVSGTLDTASEAKTSSEPFWGNSSYSPFNYRTTSAIAKIETPMSGFSTSVTSTVLNSQHQSSAAGGDGSGVIDFKGSTGKSEVSVAPGTHVQISSTSPAPISGSSTTICSTVASSVNSSAPSTQLFTPWTSSSSATTNSLLGLTFPSTGVSVETSSTSAAATSSAGFSFGTPSTPATATAGSSSAVSSTPAADASNRFKFGAVSTPAAATTTSTGITFGASSAPMTATTSTGSSIGTSSSSPSTTPSAGFPFGASSAPASITPIAVFPFGASTTPAAAATNPFGASTTPAAAATNPFGTSSTSGVTVTSGGFSSGASSTPAATSPVWASSNLPATGTGSGIGFPFGASSTPTASATNPFGASLVPTATATNPFGASSTPAATVTNLFGASSTPATSSTGNRFLFGASSTPAASTTGTGFPFGTSSTQATTASNPFGASSTPAASSTGIGFSFGASSSTPATAAGFPFGTSATPATTTSTSSGFNVGSSSTPPGFSFNTSSSAPPATNTGSPFGFMASTFNNTPSAQPIFGNSNPFGSVPAPNNNPQTTGMEDSMAEDSMQASQPSFPVFGQQQTPNNASGFGFSAPAAPASASNLYQFQSNPNMLNPSAAFQGSGSLGGFNAAGGSFSLGSGGGDKSNRRIIKPKKGRKK